MLNWDMLKANLQLSCFNITNPLSQPRAQQRYTGVKAYGKGQVSVAPQTLSKSGLDLAKGLTRDG